MRLFHRFDRLTKVFADGGYTGTLINWAREMFGYDVEVVKRNELHTFKVLPKRWIVERTSLDGVVEKIEQRLRTSPNLLGSNDLD